jgi:hypothetical protein
MRLYLHTCESISDEVGVRHIIERLKRLPHRVMLRIPIQWNGSKMDDPGVYKDAPWPWESALVRVTPTG